MDKETYICAVLECNFTGFKDEIIERVTKKIMDYKDPAKHGRWIGESLPIKTLKGEIGGAVTRITCSVCGKISIVRSDYCPNCGARMDGEKALFGTKEYLHTEELFDQNNEENGIDR